MARNQYGHGWALSAQHPLLLATHLIDPGNAMKLYHFRRSPYSSRCRMLINFKGLDIELIEPPEDFSSIHPVARIPSLHIDALVIPEAEVICEYLEDQFPTPSLRAENPAKRALVRTINRINDIYILAPMFDLAPHVEMQSRDQAVVEQKFEELVLGLVRLNHFIEGPDYAVGNTLTLADCALVPTLYVMTRYLPSFDRADQLKKHPKISSYWERIQHNPRAVPIIDDLAAAMRDRL